MILERPRYNEKYIPSADTIRFFLWQSKNGKRKANPAVAHLMLMDLIFSDNKKTGAFAHRSFAKTTLVGTDHLIYTLENGETPTQKDVNFILYCMDTAGMAKNHANNLKMKVEASEVLEIKKATIDDMPNLEIWNKALKKKMYVKLRSTGQSMRGIIVGDDRPNLIYYDDIENDKMMISDGEREKVTQWFLATVSPIGNKDTEHIFLGTPLHDDSLLMKLVNGKQYKFIPFPVAEELKKEWLTDIELLKKNAVLSWPEWITPEYLIEQYQTYVDGKAENLFFQEWMLELIPEGAELFQMDAIKWVSQENFDLIAPTLSYVISIDPAISQKDSADYTSIVVIGFNSNGDWFLCDGIMARIRPDELINTTFALVKQYKPYTVLIEGVAFQQALETFMEQEMFRQNLFFDIDMIRRPNVANSKLGVIKSLTPVINRGKFHIVEGSGTYMGQNFIDQASRITDKGIFAKFDDVVDSVAQINLSDVAGIVQSVSDGSSQLDMSGYKSNLVM